MIYLFRCVRTHLEREPAYCMPDPLLAREIFESIAVPCWFFRLGHGILPDAMR